jgi:PadR family transcriptional regulator PadR
MLDRFLSDGWVEDAWELPHETTTKKPRRYYTLTDRGRRELGAVAAQAEVAGIEGLGWTP